MIKIIRINKIVKIIKIMIMIKTLKIIKINYELDALPLQRSVINGQFFLDTCVHFHTSIYCLGQN